MKSKTCVGIMSGTSVDGIDVVIAEFSMSGSRIKSSLKGFAHYLFPQHIKEKIFKSMDVEKSSVCDICELNFELGKLYAASVKKTLKRHNYSSEDIFVIGSHGQTIFHIPQNTSVNRKKFTASTLQIGDGNVIANITGITTVSDFRTADIAAGGHGAPLVPFADYHLFRHQRKNRILQNIGGIANTTYLKAGCSPEEIIAFDNGPGNMMIDHAVYRFTDGKQSFDKDGKFAACGKISKDILNYMLNNDYFLKSPPKTTGREIFGKQYTDKLISEFKISGKKYYDFIATLTMLTARTIADSYKKFILRCNKIDEVILAGGGAKNKTLIKMLAEELPNIDIIDMSETGIVPESKEGLSFAMLAYATMNHIPANVPSATGAKHTVILGKVSYTE